MIKNIQALYAALSSVCPIDGVDADGTIWFSATATAAQKAAAQSALAAFVDSDPKSIPAPPKAPPPAFKDITEA